MGAAQRQGRQAGREAKPRDQWLPPVIEAQMPVRLPSASSSSDVGATHMEPLCVCKAVRTALLTWVVAGDICALGAPQCPTPSRPQPLIWPLPISRPLFLSLSPTTGYALVRLSQEDVHTCLQARPIPPAVKY